MNLHTVRYYERRGLLPEPQPTRLRLIKTGQRLGFTLNEIADPLDVHAHPRRHGRKHNLHAGLRDRAQVKLSEIEAKIAELTLIAYTLKQALAAGCDDLLTCTEQPACPLSTAVPASSETTAQPGQWPGRTTAVLPVG